MTVIGGTQLGTPGGAKLVAKAGPGDDKGAAETPQAPAETAPPKSKAAEGTKALTESGVRPSMNGAETAGTQAAQGVADIDEPAPKPEPEPAPKPEPEPAPEPAPAPAPEPEPAPKPEPPVDTVESLIIRAIRPIARNVPKVLAAVEAAPTAVAATVGEVVATVAKPASPTAPGLGNVIGRIGVAASAAIAGIDVYNNIQAEGEFGPESQQAAGRGIGGIAGGIAGAKGGAIAGAAIGAFGGPIGIAIGGGVGALVGAIAGSTVGMEVGEKFAVALDEHADELIESGAFAPAV